MKRILIFVAAMAIFSTSYSQLPINCTSATYGNLTDTVTSTAAHYMVSGVIAGNKTVSVVVKGLEISGTTAGTATLQASNDGVLWYDYYQAHDTSYSFTFTDVSTAQSFRWDLSALSDRYLRVKVVGISTPNFIISAKYVVKN